MTDQDKCGEWMPRAKTNCVRGPGHRPPCKSPEAMGAQRQRTAAREKPYDPAAKARWNRAHKLVRYGLTPQS
ncbi:MAG TPA: hypothetical protein VF834_08770 [Streptosporangiaceae bacterium]